jgi:hypothetical protein
VSATDAAIRDQARAVAPELTTLLGAADSTVPVAVTARLDGVRLIVGAWGSLASGVQLVGLGYVLAHRITRDLMGSQGSTSAPIGSGSTAGAVSSTSVGGMSIGYGGSGFVPQSPGDAELMTTQYGQAWLGIRSSLARPNMPLCR